MKCKHLINKFFLLPFLLSIFIWKVGSVSAQESYAMTLEECIEFAMQNNRQLQNSRLEKSIAKENIDEVISTGYPQIDGQANIQNYFEIPVTIIPDFNDPESGRFTEAQFLLPWQAQAGITANQLLFDGTFFLGIKAARELSALTEKQVYQSQEDLVVNVSKAYYTALISQEQLSILEANIERVQRLYKETDALFTEGFAEKIDVERLQISLNNLELDHQKASRMLRISIDILKFQIGLPVTSELALTENISAMLEPSLETFSVENFAVQDKIEYKVLQGQRELQLLNIKRYKVEHLPKVYAFGSYNWNRQWEFNSDNRFSYFQGVWGIQLDVPLFDGFRKRALIRRSKLELYQIDNNIDDFENNALMQLRTSERSVLNAINSLESTRKTLELAEKIYRIARVKYKEGVGSSLEINDAETQLKEAESNLLRSTYDYLTARLDWEKASGKLSRYHQE